MMLCIVRLPSGSDDEAGGEKKENEEKDNDAGDKGSVEDVWARTPSTPGQFLSVKPKPSDCLFLCQ